MKKIIVLLLSFICSFNLFTFAADPEVDDFVIIPEASWKVGEITENISKEWWKVWEKYNKEYSGIKNDLWAQFATGVFWWNSILLFIKYLIKFLSQVGMVIGALMIIYSGYIYANAVWTGNATKWVDPLKKAIIWVVIIIWSYAIMKILTSMFLGF